MAEHTSVSHSDNMGYLIIDHRGGGGKLEEFDTVSCKHCQAVIKIIPGKREDKWCGLCAGPICEFCHAKGVCEPFWSKIERQLARERFLRSAGLL